MPISSSDPNGLAVALPKAAAGAKIFELTAAETMQSEHMALASHHPLRA
jgi:hypothetical protein